MRLPRLGFPLAIAGHGPVAEAAGSIQDGGLGNVDPVARKAAITAGLRIWLAQKGALAVQPAFERAQSRERAWVDAGYRIRRSATTRVAASGTLVTGPRMTAGGGFGSGCCSFRGCWCCRGRRGTAVASGPDLARQADGRAGCRDCGREQKATNLTPLLPLFQALPFRRPGRNIAPIMVCSRLSPSAASMLPRCSVKLLTLWEQPPVGISARS